LSLLLSKNDLACSFSRRFWRGHFGEAFHRTQQTVPRQLGSASSGCSPSPRTGSPRPPCPANSCGTLRSCPWSDGTRVKHNRGDSVYHWHPILWKGLREVPKVPHGLCGEEGSGTQVPAAAAWHFNCGATFPLQWPTEQDSLLGLTSKGAKSVKETRINFSKLRRNCFSWVCVLLHPLFLHRRYRM